MACLFVEELTVLDFSRLDAERGLVGESWIVDIELEGELDEQSMVLDFGEVKRAARQALEDCADHRLLVPAGAEVAGTSASATVRFPWAGNRLVRVVSPADAFTRVPAGAVEAATVRPMLEAAVRGVVPASVHRIGIGIREESRAGHYYHYSHGLKRHAGLCQRIAHGHRSRIEILRDGLRDDGLEAGWARRWEDVYLGSAEDLVGETKTPAETRLEFAYDAPAGRFELSLDSRCVEVIPTDSTVECLAAYVANQLHRDDPGGTFAVRAYEGIRKGAIGRAGPASGVS